MKRLSGMRRLHFIFMLGDKPKERALLHARQVKTSERRLSRF